jgi:hypothetical protein
MDESMIIFSLFTRKIVQLDGSRRRLKDLRGIPFGRCRWRNSHPLYLLLQLLMHVLDEVMFLLSAFFGCRCLRRVSVSHHMIIVVVVLVRVVFIVGCKRVEIGI